MVGRLDFVVRVGTQALRGARTVHPRGVSEPADRTDRSLPGHHISTVECGAHASSAVTKVVPERAGAPVGQPVTYRRSGRGGTRTEYAEFVAFGIGEHDPGLFALADIGAFRSEGK